MQAHHVGPPPDERVQELQRKLADLRAGNASLLRTRLAHAHPWHLTRVARGVFLALTALCVVLLLASLTVPLILPDLALLVREIEDALPLPLPMLILFLALLMAVSWVTAGQAALAIARDCPLLPWEEKERKKLESELSILTKSAAGSGLVSEESYGSGPPPLAMPQSRLGSNNPSSTRGYPSPVPTAGGTLRYETRPSFPLGDASRPPGGSSSTGGSSYGGGSYGGTGTPGTGSTTGGSIIRKLTNPGATRRATPAGATPAPRSATPASNLSYRGPGGETRTTPGSAPPRPGPGSDKATPTSDAGIVYERRAPEQSYERRPHDSYTISPSSVGDSLNDPPSGAASWKQPRFAHVDEPWLQDALGKAQSLSSRYPVQAFLEYSVEPDLPFTLVLERATPAMAVRAMVDFVGFLASISTPRRARIELRSVVHLDRSFYRSVMSAMEPYFPDTVEIRQQGYRVEITFLEPDRNWARYPILPIEE